jgi:hypothetical protein
MKSSAKGLATSHPKPAIEPIDINSAAMAFMALSGMVMFIVSCETLVCNYNIV